MKTWLERGIIRRPDPVLPSLRAVSLFRSGMVGRKEGACERENRLQRGNMTRAASYTSHRFINRLIRLI